MNTENKRESNVRLEPETKREIERDFAENSHSDNKTLLELYKQQIVVLEKDKESNLELLQKYYDLREELDNKIKAEEDSCSSEFSMRE